MAGEVKIESLETIEENLVGLSELLIRVVNDGAAVGFMPPLNRSDAQEYWENVLCPGVILFVAKIEGRIAGTVQLHLSMKQNGLHRADIAKMMTHPDYRRRGIARSLLQYAEVRAKQEGRSLLVLDTREGDPSNELYASQGFIPAGRIPDYAKSANGELHATILYYKKLD